MAVVSHLCLSPLWGQFQTTMWTESQEPWDTARRNSTCHSSYLHFPWNNGIWNGAASKEWSILPLDGCSPRWMSFWNGCQAPAPESTGEPVTPLLPWTITLRGHNRAGSECLMLVEVPMKQTDITGDKVTKNHDKMQACFLFPMSVWLRCYAYSFWRGTWLVWTLEL